MLELLPNEILVTILSKTKKETTKTCRLLNSRFNQVVTKFGLNKEDLQELWIKPSSFNFKEPITTWDIQAVDQDSRKKRNTFENYGILLSFLPNYLEQIRSAETLWLINIKVCEELLDIILSADCLRKITNLSVLDCNFSRVVSNKWLIYLEHLHLHKFHANNSEIENTTPVPFKMCERVSNYFFYNSFTVENAFDMSWFDDEMLLNWYRPGKTLQIWKCQTGLTIHGIIKCLKEIWTHNVRFWLEFGTITKVAPRVVKKALKATGANWHSFQRIDTLKTYKITTIYGKSVNCYFSLQRPEE